MTCKELRQCRLHLYLPIGLFSLDLAIVELLLAVSTHCIALVTKDANECV